MPFDYNKWLAGKTGTTVPDTAKTFDYDKWLEKKQEPSTVAGNWWEQSTLVGRAKAFGGQVGESLKQMVSPKELSEGTRELLDEIVSAKSDPTTAKGFINLAKTYKQIVKPVEDWYRFHPQAAINELSQALISGGVKGVKQNVANHLASIIKHPIAGPVTLAMILGAKRPVKQKMQALKYEVSPKARVSPVGETPVISETPPKSKPRPAPKVTKPVAKVGKLTADQEAGLAALDDMYADLLEQKGAAKTFKQREFFDKQMREIGKQKEAVIRGEPEIKPIEPTEVVKPEVVKSDIDASVKKVTKALKEAKPVRGEQEALYTQERTARLAKVRGVRETTTGEKGFYAELGQLKGELPKVTFESLREKISQADIDNVFNKVKDAEILTDWEKITAREGLAKMFGEYGGRVPTEGELALLDQVFPADFLEAVMAKRPLWTKMKEGGLQVANIPRSIMASFDLSFGGRQGAFAAAKFRREFWTSWKEQFKIFGSEKAYQASREALTKDPDFLFAKESKVPFTDIGKKLGLREERFASQWAEKIPLIGRGVRASGRAYTAFANRYRLNIFKSMVRDAERMGFNPRKNRYMARKMGEFVGSATGRGSLGGFENAALALNAVFFSPRLNMARIRTLNPVYYFKQPKGVRKQALATAFGAAGLATTILTLAKIGGGEVEPDPRSADFGKIKIGNTRLDMLAGYGQFIRGGAQVITGQYISSTTGRKIDLGEGYRPLTRMDIIYRQIESKEAPIASFATGLLRGTNWAGEDFNIIRETRDRFVPMVIADAIDIAKDDPELLGLTAPAIFGIGVMTYPPRGRRRLTMNPGGRIGSR